MKGLNQAISYAFQPIININSQKIFSFEALIRSITNQSPEAIFAQVKPADLLEFDQLGRDKAITLAMQLGLSCHINLNFLPTSLINPKYLEQTLASCDRHQMRPSQLIIEITEVEALHYEKAVIQNLNIYRRLNIKIAIDDFGAGYAGLNLLANFQPDIIKLDMQLIRGIESHGPRQAIVKAILQVCMSLGIEVIAEGVETLPEFIWLKNKGIELFQGYLFAKPAFECFPSVYYPD